MARTRTAEVEPKPAEVEPEAKTDAPDVKDEPVSDTLAGANGSRRRRSALVKDDEFADSEELANTSVESGQWARVLRNLKQRTEAGEVPVDEKTGKLKMKKLAVYGNPSGANTALRALKKNPAKVPGTFDFEVVRGVDTEGKTVSSLWARYAG